MPGIEDDLLRLRVMLCFLESAPGDCTVTGISRTLKEEKYKISRVLIALEKEGLVDRFDTRNPHLTEKGQEAAKRLRTGYRSASTTCSMRAWTATVRDTIPIYGRSTARMTRWMSSVKVRNATVSNTPCGIRKNSAVRSYATSLKTGGTVSRF